MAIGEFAPGFRLSKLDIMVLFIGAAVTTATIPYDGAVAFIIAFVIAHFFLFCNVFRVARPLELTWAGWFILLAGGTLSMGMPGWPIATIATLIATVAVIAVEMRKPSYHGIGWQRINPQLPDWWLAQSVNSPR